MSIVRDRTRDAGWTSLLSRVTMLEAECADAREQARLLGSLHAAFTQIAATKSPDDVVRHILRTARDPLGFSRAIYFAVGREAGIRARLQIDGSDSVEASFETPDVEARSALLRAMREGAGEAVGVAGELSPPLVDVRGWYVISTLRTADGNIGVLYVDGHANPAPREWETNLVRSLTTIGAVSIDNGVLFEKTRELATRDPLTGLFNRRAFSERLLGEIEESRRRGRSLTYVMIDVDDFKSINDSLGHAHGDTVLRTLAGTLARSSRTSDVVGRYAGDEFVVLLANVEREVARSRVARLSADLRGAGLRCSLGAASFPDDASDAASLLVAADRALYATKAAGKDGFSFA